ncbi:MAG: peptidylprolyl isomerase [Pseudomonadota bacterium]|nr:peptidylprolyl isomerase [Pseudomonadota bacterium]
MFIMWLVLGCKGPEMEAENAKLTQRVADLERTRDRLEKDNEALKARVKRAQEEEDKAKQSAALEKLGLKDGQKLVATFQTSLGDIQCVLRPEQAPETVANFVQLARGEKAWTDPNTGKETTRPLYDGTIFHRVIPDFMIQGGDPLGNGTGDPGYKFADEVGDFTVFDKTGLLAMANSGPDTNGSQFFITEGTPTHLNGKHTIFGDCENLDVVAKIARVPSKRDKPDTDVVIKRVVIAAR